MATTVNAVRFSLEISFKIILHCTETYRVSLYLIVLILWVRMMAGVGVFVCLFAHYSP